mmetsp:Transcript_42624/g.106441  ORF Transcript_42624/g.106441 Transcript_42624/m.106441 type:complete len:291 (+) Transcript_42624:592-1464(+)
MARLRRPPQEGQALQAQDDHHGCVCVSPRDRLQQVPRDLRRGRLLPAGGHRPHQRPGGRQGAHVALSVRRHRHHHHTQVPQGAAGGHDLLQQEACARRRGEGQLQRVPQPAGRPAQPPDRRARHATQGGRHARVRRIRQTGCVKHEGVGRGVDGQGLQVGDGRQRQPPGPLGRQAPRTHRIQSRKGVRCGAHHSQQERRVRRRVGHVAGRRARGHPRHDDPRVQGGRLPAGGRVPPPGGADLPGDPAVARQEAQRLRQGHPWQRQDQRPQEGRRGVGHQVPVPRQPGALS